MKRTMFITIFITTHILFAILHIHKNTHFIKQTFAKQKNDMLLEQLEINKQELTKQWYICKNQVAIKKYANKAFQLKPMSIKQVKKLGRYDQQTI